MAEIFLKVTLVVFCAPLFCYYGRDFSQKQAFNFVRFFELGLPVYTLIEYLRKRLKRKAQITSYRLISAFTPIHIQALGQDGRFPEGFF